MKICRYIELYSNRIYEQSGSLYDLAELVAPGVLYHKAVRQTQRMGFRSFWGSARAWASCAILGL